MNPTDGEPVLEAPPQSQSEVSASEVVNAAAEQETTAQTSEEQTELPTSVPARAIGETEEEPTSAVEESSEQIAEGTEEQDQTADVETDADAEAQAPQEVLNGDDQAQGQGDEAFVGDEVDAEVEEDAEGEYEEEPAEGEGDAGEEGVHDVNDGEVEGEGEEEEEEYEGDEADPYGVDKLVDGISEDEAQAGEDGHDEAQTQGQSELNGSEEVLEEYQEGMSLSLLTYPGYMNDDADWI